MPEAPHEEHVNEGPDSDFLVQLRLARGDTPVPDGTQGVRSEDFPCTDYITLSQLGPAPRTYNCDGDGHYLCTGCIHFRETPCDHCGGAGSISVEGWKPAIMGTETCKECGGTGKQNGRVYKAE